MFRHTSVPQCYGPRDQRRSQSHQRSKVQSDSSTAAFFLPGLVHQFGNLLLTVQGHVLHLDAAGIQRMQVAVLGVVQRGSSSLQVLRALLGDQTGAIGCAAELLAQLVELGRVPARECGLTLDMRGEPLQQSVWVAAEPFVLTCAEALRQFVTRLPAASTGVVTIQAVASNGQPLRLQFGYEQTSGDLPFPVSSREVLQELAATLAHAGASGELWFGTDPQRPGIEIRFPLASLARESQQPGEQGLTSESG